MPPDPLPLLPDSQCGTGPGSVPVYNCMVILTPVEGTCRLRGRVANLGEISAEGNSERDVLIQLTRRFKDMVRHCMGSNSPIPWTEPPETPGPNEQQRFIPVHL